MFPPIDISLALQMMGLAFVAGGVLGASIMRLVSGP